MSKKNYAELLQQRKYDPNRPAPTEQVVFVIDSKNIGTLQNFVTITGMQKSGKTTFMSAMMASALTNTDILGMWLHLPEGRRRVSFWDTEQGDYDFHRTMEKVRVFCHADKLPVHFDAFNLREDDPKDILFLIDKYLELNKDCGLLVVDGILDLIDSFNDETESKKLINKLKRLTKVENLLALLTLHKGKTTSNTLGHLGSMADRAAQSVLVVEKIKEKGTFVLKSDFLRSSEDFDPIEIQFNKGEHRWERTEHTPEQTGKVRKLQLRPLEISKDIHASHVLKIFMFQEIQTFREIVKNISELYGRGTNWAKECLSHLMKENLVFRVLDGYTNRHQTTIFPK
jgi:KaiC/GvpD/RAD55 family RecA-like ATPase